MYSRNSGATPDSARRLKTSPLRKKTAAVAAPLSDRAELGESREHRVQVERRTADHLQNVGGRSLLFQCLGQVTGARLHFIKQAHVVDGDHGLVSEGLKQRDLPVRERARLELDKGDRANRLAVAKHRHSEHRPETDLDDCIRRVFRILRNIGDMNDRAG